MNIYLIYDEEPKHPHVELPLVPPLYGHLHPGVDLRGSTYNASIVFDLKTNLLTFIQIIVNSSITIMLNSPLVLLQAEHLLHGYRFINLASAWKNGTYTYTLCHIRCCLTWVTLSHYTYCQKRRFLGILILGLVQ